MTVTSRFALTKPQPTELADPALLNGNWDIIDNELSYTENAGAGSTGCLAATYSRLGASTIASAGAATSGQPRLMGIVLKKGTLVSHLTVWAGTTAGASMTHSWMGLADASRNKLGVTNDITTATWTASTSRTFDMVSPYTVPSTGFYYVVLCVVGTTMPTIEGVANLAAGARNAAPIAGGNSSTTGLTTPGGAPATYGALTVLGQHHYVEVT